MRIIHKVVRQKLIPKINITQGSSISLHFCSLKSSLFCKIAASVPFFSNTFLYLLLVSNTATTSTTYYLLRRIFILMQNTLSILQSMVCQRSMLNRHCCGKRNFNALHFTFQTYSLSLSIFNFLLGIPFYITMVANIPQRENIYILECHKIK